MSKKYYSIDMDKVTTIDHIRLILACVNFTILENCEQFYILKHLLKISSLEKELLEVKRRKSFGKFPYDCHKIMNNRSPAKVIPINKHMSMADHILDAHKDK